MKSRLSARRRSWYFPAFLASGIIVFLVAPCHPSCANRIIDLRKTGDVMFSKHILIPDEPRNPERFVIPHLRGEPLPGIRLFHKRIRRDTDDPYRQFPPSHPAGIYRSYDTSVGRNAELVFEACQYGRHLADIDYLYGCVGRLHQSIYVSRPGRLFSPYAPNHEWTLQIGQSTLRDTQRAQGENYRSQKSGYANERNPELPYSPADRLTREFCLAPTLAKAGIFSVLGFSTYFLIGIGILPSMYPPENRVKHFLCRHGLWIGLIVGCLTYSLLIGGAYMC